MEVQDLRAFSQHSITISEYSWKMLKHTNSHVASWWTISCLLEADGESSRDRVENKKMHDVEMEQIGADIAAIAMDETLQ